MKPTAALLLAICVLVAGNARADDSGKKEDDAVKKDLAALQGAWVIVAKEFMGKMATKEEVAQLTGEMIIKDGKRTQWKDDAGLKEVVNEATLELDPQATPKGDRHHLHQWRRQGGH